MRRGRRRRPGAGGQGEHVVATQPLRDPWSDPVRDHDIDLFLPADKPVGRSGGVYGGLQCIAHPGKDGLDLRNGRPRGLKMKDDVHVRGRPGHGQSGPGSVKLDDESADQSPVLGGKVPGQLDALRPRLAPATRRFGDVPDFAAVVAYAVSHG